MNICSITEKNSVRALALGGFDGVHLGHRALIERLGEGGAMLAIEHRRVCLTPGCSRERFSAAPVLFVELESVAQLAPSEFIARLKAEFPRLERLVVGYDFRFGKDRAASGEDLRELFDGESIVVPEVRLGGVAVHAARIRSLLLDGNVAAAAKLLARDHMVEGAIIKGQGLGAARLYPTLNLETRRFLAPLDGVYASRTEVAGRLYPSVSFVGRRLSADGAFAIETHILSEETRGIADGRTIGADLGLRSQSDSSAKPFDGATTAAIFFADRLRENRRFETLDELKFQIGADIAAAKTILGIE